MDDLQRINERVFYVLTRMKCMNERYSIHCSEIDDDYIYSLLHSHYRYKDEKKHQETLNTRDMMIEEMKKDKILSRCDFIKFETADELYNIRIRIKDTSISKLIDIINECSTRAAEKMYAAIKDGDNYDDALDFASNANHKYYISKFRHGD